MAEFDVSNMSTASLSKESIDQAKYIMDEIHKSASPDLKMAIDKQKTEIDDFIGVPAVNVLNRSYK